eukprot:7055108-Pyramimonas_sp.AAC.1
MPTLDGGQVSSKGRQGRTQHIFGAEVCFGDSLGALEEEEESIDGLPKLDASQASVNGHQGRTP